MMPAINEKNTHSRIFLIVQTHWNKESAGQHVAPFGHIIPILRQSVFPLTTSWCVLREEVTHANVIVFGLTRPVFESTIYRNLGEHANH